MNLDWYKKLTGLDMSDARRIQLAAGVILVFLSGWNFYMGATSSLETGRWSWFYHAVSSAAGPYGWPLFQLLAGLMLIAGARKI